MIANEVQETNRLDSIIPHPQSPDPDHLNENHDQRMGSTHVPLRDGKPIGPESERPKSPEELDQAESLTDASVMYREQDQFDFPHFFPVQNNNTNTPADEISDCEEQDSKDEVRKKINLDWSLFNRNIGSERGARSTELQYAAFPARWSDADSLINLSRHPGHLNFLNENHDKEEGSTPPRPIPECHNLDWGFQQLINPNLIRSKESLQVAEKSDESNPKAQTNSNGKESSAPAPLENFLTSHTGDKVSDGDGSSFKGHKTKALNDSAVFLVETCGSSSKQLFTSSNTTILLTHKPKFSGHSSGGKRIKCEYCDQDFTTKYNMERHIGTRHSRLKPYSSRTSPKFFTHQEFTLVKTGNQLQKIFKCNYCDKFFTRSRELINHEKTHDGDRPYKSKDCRETYAHGSTLEAHKRGKHDGKKYECTYCDKTFGDYSSLIFHREKQHTREKRYKCRYCDKTFLYESKMIAHRKNQHPGGIFCSKKSFNRISMRNRHIAKHTGEKPYKCDHCPKTFRNKRAQVLHTRTHTHTVENPFKCSYCPNKSFYSAYTRNRHIATHTGEKPYTCDHCPKTFATYDGKVVHTRTHTGEKPYKCGYCPNKSFYRISMRNGHIATHTGEKPYKCDHCPKTFRNKSAKVIHTRTHTGEKPYKCGYCPNKSFYNAYTRNRHIARHTGEKLYECDHCPKTFVNSCGKVLHMRTHTGEKPYKCRYCQKTFSQINSRNVHIRTHISKV